MWRLELKVKSELKSRNSWDLDPYRVASPSDRSHPGGDPRNYNEIEISVISGLKVGSSLRNLAEL